MKYVAIFGGSSVEVLQTEVDSFFADNPDFTIKQEKQSEVIRGTVEAPVTNITISIWYDEKTL